MATVVGGCVGSAGGRQGLAALGRVPGLVAQGAAPIPPHTPTSTMWQPSRGPAYLGK